MTQDLLTLEEVAQLLRVERHTAGRLVREWEQNVPGVVIRLSPRSARVSRGNLLAYLERQSLENVVRPNSDAPLRDRMIEALGGRECMSKFEMVRAFGVSESTIEREVRKLIDSGAVRVHTPSVGGRGKQTADALA